jgi:hypothetical protein
MSAVFTSDQCHDELSLAAVVHPRILSSATLHGAYTIDTIKVYDVPFPKDNSVRGRGAYAKV